MKNWTRSVAATLALAVLVMTLPSCGSSTGTTVPVRIVITNQNFGLATGETAFLDINITGSGSGTLDATANWTFSSDDVDLYVTTTSCPLDGGISLLLGLCSVITKADSSTNKPERVSLSVSGGSVYRIWIVNLGPGAESGTIEVGLTR